MLAVKRSQASMPGTCFRNEVEPHSVQMLPGEKRVGYPAEDIVFGMWNLAGVGWGRHFGAHSSSPSPSLFESI